MTINFFTAKQTALRKLLEGATLKAVYPAHTGDEYHTLYGPPRAALSRHWEDSWIQGALNGEWFAQAMESNIFTAIMGCESVMVSALDIQEYTKYRVVSPEPHFDPESLCKGFFEKLNLNAIITDVQHHLADPRIAWSNQPSAVQGIFSSAMRGLLHDIAHSRFDAPAVILRDLRTWSALSPAQQYLVSDQLGRKIHEGMISAMLAHGLEVEAELRIPWPDLCEGEQSQYRYVAAYALKHFLAFLEGGTVPDEGNNGQD